MSQHLLQESHLTIFGIKFSNMFKANNKESNQFEKYVDMKKAKREIELKFNSDSKICDSVLKSRELFSKYLFDIYLLPDLKTQGASFKESEKYKIFMHFIQDYQFYAKIKNNYIIKELEEYNIKKLNFAPNHKCKKANSKITNK